MAKLGAKATMKLEMLEDSQRKVERIRALTEQYAGARSGQDQFMMNIIRTATYLQRALMMNGFGTMADSANQIVMLARRGGTPATKARNLREHTGTLMGALERGMKGVRVADVEAQAKKAAKTAGG